MRVCLFLLVTLVAVLVLAETGSASKSKRKAIQEDGTAPEEGEHRRGNRQHGKEKKDKKGRGRHHENPTEGTVIVGFDDIAQGVQTADVVPTEPMTQEEPQETPAEEPQEEATSPKQGHKKGHKGENAEGGRPDKAARRAAKEERLRLRQEKQAQKEMRKEGKAARKEARKETKRGENQEGKLERKQARKEAKKMERNDMMADCSEHSDCPTGLECFVSEGKQAKNPEGTAKGHCRSTEVDDAAEQPVEEEAPAQDEE